MKHLHFFTLTGLLFMIFALSNCATYSGADTINEPSGITWSQLLLSDIKAGKSGKEAISGLAQLDPQMLVTELDEKDKQLAFWINVYNGMVQYLLTTEPELWEARNNFFSTERFIVAGESLSLEDVEHGIIRGGENKLGLGYIPQFFPGKFKKTFKIKGGDGRVHFALNCGAIDCPPVEIYDPSTIDDRLNHRSRIYVNKHSAVSEDGKLVTTTPLFSWFRGDFKAYGGINGFLVAYGVLTKEQENIKRDFKNYDWTLATNVWAND